MFRVKFSASIVVSCPNFGRHMWTGHETQTIWSLVYKELIVYVTYWGWGCYSCDVRDDIKVAGRILQTCRNLAAKKMLSAIVVSVNQEKNWNFTTWHNWSCHFCKTENSTKLVIHHIASLDLLILQKLETGLHIMGSLELLFLWTSILLQTAWFMLSKIPQRE